MRKRESSGSVQEGRAATGVPWPVYEATTVSEFLDLLVPTAEQWSGAGAGDLGYRGQAVASWGLVPRAFREGQLEEAKGKSGRRRVGRQAQAEFHAVHEFLTAADAAGLPIPERGGQLLLQEDPAVIFGRVDWEREWPQQQVWEALALAQHHRVVTRLLDFTENPLVAAFFAAFDAWNRRAQDVDEEECESIAVWIVDLRFVRAINRIKKQFPERIAVVRVPRANNAYLHAQEGIFLIDRGANDVLYSGDGIGLEDIIVQRARYWRSDRLKDEGIARVWFGDIPIAKVCLTGKLVVSLLKELQARNVTLGRLMPSLDRVVEALSTDKDIAMAE